MSFNDQEKRRVIRALEEISTSLKKIVNLAERISERLEVKRALQEESDWQDALEEEAERLMGDESPSPGGVKK